MTVAISSLGELQGICKTEQFLKSHRFRFMFYQVFIATGWIKIAWNEMHGKQKGIESTVIGSCLQCNKLSHVQVCISISLLTLNDLWCTGTVLNLIFTAQWEGMGGVGLARYELALHSPCPTLRDFSYCNF